MDANTNTRRDFTTWTTTALVSRIAREIFATGQTVDTAEDFKAALFARVGHRQARKLWRAEVKAIKAERAEFIAAA